MKYSYLFLTISIFAFSIFTSSCSSEKNSNNVDGFDPMTYRGSDRVETLLSSMTLEDKIGEMTQITLEFMCQNDSEGKRIEPHTCLLYTSPSPRDMRRSRMPSSA